MARERVVNDEWFVGLTQALRTFRELQGLTQRDLEGIPQSMVSYIELGTKDVQVSTLGRYIDALGVRVTWHIEMIPEDEDD